METVTMSLNNLNYMNMMSGMNMYGMYNMNSFDMYGMGGCNSNPYINWNLFSNVYQYGSMGYGCGCGNSNNNIWGMMGLVGGSIFGGIATSWISDGISESRAEKAQTKAKETEAETSFYNALEALGLGDKDILTLSEEHVKSIPLTKEAQDKIDKAQTEFDKAKKEVDTTLQNAIDNYDKTNKNIKDLQQSLNGDTEHDKPINDKIAILKNTLKNQEEEKNRLLKLKASTEEGGTLYNALQTAKQAEKDLEKYKTIVTNNLSKYQSERRAELKKTLDAADGERSDRTKKKNEKWRFQNEGNNTASPSGISLNVNYEDLDEKDWMGIVNRYNTGSPEERTAIHNFVKEHQSELPTDNKSLYRGLEIILTYDNVYSSKK